MLGYRNVAIIYFFEGDGSVESLKLMTNRNLSCEFGQDISSSIGMASGIWMLGKSPFVKHGDI